jgi:hypothetical protein
MDKEAIKLKAGYYLNFFFANFSIDSSKLVSILAVYNHKTTFLS